MILTYVTDTAIKEIIKHGASYKKWLIFGINIDHVEHITETLLQSGINANLVHSKMKPEKRDKIIHDYRISKLKCLVNVNIATTGLDVPDIDLIVMLRPTNSPVFHVQTAGRGLRIHPGKDHCLILDFAGNTERLGAINDIKVKAKRKSEETGEPIVKKCPKCDTLHHPTVKVCSWCGHEFEFKTKLQTGSTGRQIIKNNMDEKVLTLSESGDSP